MAATSTSFIKMSLVYPRLMFSCVMIKIRYKFVSDDSQFVGRHSTKRVMSGFLKVTLVLHQNRLDVS